MSETLKMFHVDASALSRDEFHALLDKIGLVAFDIRVVAPRIAQVFIYENDRYIEYFSDLTKGCSVRLIK